MLRRFSQLGLLGIMLVGGSAAAQETHKAPDVTQKAKKEPPRWAGSEVSLSHFVNVLAAAPSAELTYNPMVSQLISIDPRWRLNEKLSLLAHIGVETELTNSDDTTRLREPLLEDIFVQGSYALPPLPWQMSASTSLRLTLPTSKEAIARRRWLQIAPSFTLRRPFPVSKKVTLTPFGSMRVSMSLATAESTVFDAPSIITCDASADNCSEFDHSGARSSFFTLTEILGVDASFSPKVSGQLMVGWIQQILYPLQDIMNPVTGEPIGTDGNGTDIRYIMQYVISVDWQATKNIVVGGGLQTVNPQLAPDSTYYWPFFNRYTTVFAKVAYVF